MLMHEPLEFGLLLDGIMEAAKVAAFEGSPNTLVHWAWWCPALTQQLVWRGGDHWPCRDIAILIIVHLCAIPPLPTTATTVTIVASQHLQPIWYDHWRRECGRGNKVTLPTIPALDLSGGRIGGDRNQLQHLHLAWVEGAVTLHIGLLNSSVSDPVAEKAVGKEKKRCNLHFTTNWCYYIRPTILVDRSSFCLLSDNNLSLLALDQVSALWGLCINISFKFCANNHTDLPKSFRQPL